ncbi:MAG: hypothetical protein HY675_09370 [Chloroflexi bacterium]|nr:hypothetical protein [Chloroflexota bacterium]
MKASKLLVGSHLKTYTALLLPLLLILVVAISPNSVFPQASAPVSPALLRTMANTDVNPYGANFFLQWEPEQWKVDKTLAMAREAGLGWAKQHFPWEDLELKKGSFWDEKSNRSTWEKYDRILALAQKYNLKVIARLDRPPDWTRKDNSRKEAPPDELKDYADFVEAVVRRYKGKIGYFQLWNEPNIWPEWGSRPIDPEGYVRLLRAGYEAAKRVDPNVFVLSAPLAQTFETSPRAMADLDYLDRMYRAGAKDYFDILFANAYGFSLPYDDPPSPNTLNFQRVLLLRDIMARYGDNGKPVWFNEFGWNAAPIGLPPNALIWGRVTEQQQAEYTVAAIEKARAEWPWAGVFNIWYFRQDGHIPPERADYYFRMVDVGFTPRPLYSAVKARAGRALSVAEPGDYQESNPALVAEGAWETTTDARASAQVFLGGRAPGSNMTISFRGTDISLLARKGPGGGTIYVTVDGREANRLPVDSNGRSHADLYSSTEEWQSRVPVAGGLPFGEHKLRLAISPAGNPEARDSFVAIDGFSVQYIGSVTWLNWAAAGAIALVVLLSTAFLWRTAAKR